MMNVAPPIGVAETPRGLLVSLPPRLGLVLSLRRTFRGVQAAAEPWTYLIPGNPGRRFGAWLAEIELQAVAARRRAWTAGDDEWNGSAARAPAAPSFAGDVTLPKKRTARPVLALLQAMAAGERLVHAHRPEGSAYRLSSSGRPVPASVAARAIRDRLIVPSCDGLFGPEWSQTWRAPAQEDIDAATHASRDHRAPGRPRRKDHRREEAAGAPQRRPRRSAREQLGQDEGTADAGRAALPRRDRARRVVA